jgi:uncharacterized protein involved in exopolysaccharide biosynthesis
MYRDELLKTENELGKFRNEHFADLPDVRNGIMNALLALRTEETARALQLDDAAKRLTEVEAQLLVVPPKVMGEVTTEGNPRIAELDAKVVQEKSLLTTVLLRLTDEHPMVKQLRAQIAEDEKQLAELPKRLPGTEREVINPVFEQLYTERLSLDREVKGLDAALRAVRARIAAQDEQLKDLMTEDKHYTDLLRQRDEKSEYYTLYNRNLVAARTKLQIDEGQYGTHVDVLEYAIEPAKPYYVPRLKLVVACLVLGVAAGVGLMFGTEFCDRSFRDMEDAAEFLGVPILGSIATIAPGHRAARRRSRALLVAAFVVAGALAAGGALYVWGRLSPGGPSAVLAQLKDMMNRLVTRLTA